MNGQRKPSFWRRTRFSIADVLVMWVGYVIAGVIW